MESVGQDWTRALERFGRAELTDTHGMERYGEVRAKLIDTRGLEGSEEVWRGAGMTRLVQIDRYNRNIFNKQTPIVR